MGEFRIGTATSEPAIGTLKLGNANVQEIYLGLEKIWPSEASNVCGLGDNWTITNSSTTATTSGPDIQIVQNANEWAIAVLQETPAAAYYNYASSDTSGRGLYYNRFAAAVIQPPPGYSTPTTLDAAKLLVETCVDTTTTPFNINTLATEGGNWNPSVYTNTTYRGNSGLNIDAFGRITGSGGVFELDTYMGGYWMYNTQENQWNAQEYGYTANNTSGYINGNSNQAASGNGHNIRFIEAT